MTPRRTESRAVLRAWAACCAGEFGAATGSARSRSTSSGAELVIVGDVVVKVHRAGTDGSALGARLAAVSGAGARPLWVAPLTSEPRLTPDGRWVTVWPRVEVLDPSSPAVPWADAGALLARWHATAPTALGGMPPHGGPDRLGRAVARARRVDHPGRPMLTRLGERLLDEVEAAAHSVGRCGGADRVGSAGQVGSVGGPADGAADHGTVEDVTAGAGGRGAPVIRPVLAHGDWHLGQLGRSGDGWQLLDIDDLGVGDPAWDLGRPAGFWAVGLLDDRSWRAFLDGYRDAAGPAVPPTGDPWPYLDLAARSAVFVAAVRELTRGPAGVSRTGRADEPKCPDGPGRSGGAGRADGSTPVDPAELRRLLTACARM
ncbi:MAG: phosphotransferase family protein [Dermatophilaceae bacterium]